MTCCIWFSRLRSAWILDIDEPGDDRYGSEAEAVQAAKLKGCTLRYDPDTEQTTDL